MICFVKICAVIVSVINFVSPVPVKRISGYNETVSEIIPFKLPNDEIIELTLQFKLFQNTSLFEAEYINSEMETLPTTTTTTTTTPSPISTTTIPTPSSSTTPTTTTTTTTTTMKPVYFDEYEDEMLIINNGGNEAENAPTPTATTTTTVTTQPQNDGVSTTNSTTSTTTTSKDDEEDSVGLTTTTTTQTARIDEEGTRDTDKGITTVNTNIEQIDVSSNKNNYEVGSDYISDDNIVSPVKKTKKTLKREFWGVAKKRIIEDFQKELVIAEYNVGGHLVTGRAGFYKYFLVSRNQLNLGIKCHYLSFKKYHFISQQRGGADITCVELSEYFLDHPITWNDNERPKNKKTKQEPSYINRTPSNIEVHGMQADQIIEFEARQQQPRDNDYVEGIELDDFTSIVNDRINKQEFGPHPTFGEKRALRMNYNKKSRDEEK